MSYANNKLEVPRWSKLDTSSKFLYVFVFTLVQIVVFTMVIYYNLLPNTHYAIGFAIMISGITTTLLVRRLKR